MQEIFPQKRAGHYGNIKKDFERFKIHPQPWEVTILDG